MGNEQLLLAGTGIQAQEGVVDEQHLHLVLGELGSPCHVQPGPQQLWGDRDSVAAAAAFPCSRNLEISTLPVAKLISLLVLPLVFAAAR